MEAVGQSCRNNKRGFTRFVLCKHRTNRQVSVGTTPTVFSGRFFRHEEP